MTPLRVLELIKSLDAGGAEMLLVDRMRARDELHFQYDVGYLCQNRNELVPTLREAGLSVTCFHSNSVMDWRWVGKLRRHLRKNRYDVVHVHSPLMAVGVRAVLLSLRARPVLVTTEHSVRHHRVTQFLALLTVKMDAYVFAVSDAVAESQICRLARRCETVHYGIELERMEEISSRRAILAREFELEGSARIVSVANFRPEKGHLNLVAVASLVHEEEPDAHFYIVGHGPQEEEVRQQVLRNDMSSWYHILGGMPDAARLTACADVFVLASVREGRPVAIMEALACGVPVLATAVGGVPAMIEPGVNGRLVAPQDVEGLAEALLDLLRDHELRAALARGAYGSRHDHDVTRAARRIEDVYVLLTKSNAR